MEAQGYDIRSIQTEHGLFEAHAMRNAERYEIHLNANFQIIHSERDD